jgi:hypothetical protein
MSKIVQLDLEKIDSNFRQRIERLSEKTGKPLDEVILDILSRKAQLSDHWEVQERLAPYGKDMTEEEVLALPRMPVKDK